MEWINDNAATIVAAFIGLHALAVAIVNLTPTPKDNEILNKAYKVIEVFGGVITKRAKETNSEG